MAGTGRSWPYVCARSVHAHTPSARPSSNLVRGRPGAPWRGHCQRSPPRFRGAASRFRAD
eukprot:188053-Lingulodinium_polyedra.AAC.1